MPEYKQYIRCHIVKAAPMTRGCYNKLRGWEMPANENPDDEGYHIIYPDGYESWCPKAQFEDASSPEALEKVLRHFHDEHYSRLHEINDVTTKRLCRAFYHEYTLLGEKHGLTFGQAIEAMKQGKKVARAGWNGKGMWLCVPLCNGPKEIPATGIWGKPNAEYAEQNGGTVKVVPYVTMKAADGTIVMGWLASQTDMLSEDWTIVE